MRHLQAGIRLTRYKNPRPWRERVRVRGCGPVPVLAVERTGYVSALKRWRRRKRSAGGGCVRKSPVRMAGRRSIRLRREADRQLVPQRIRQFQQRLNREIRIPVQHLGHVRARDAKPFRHFGAADLLIPHEPTDVLSQLNQDFLKAILERLTDRPELVLKPLLSVHLVPPLARSASSSDRIRSACSRSRTCTFFPPRACFLNPWVNTICFRPSKKP